MSKPKIDWSKNPHAGLDNDAAWLKAENAALRAELRAAEARVKELSEPLTASDRTRSVLYGEEIDRLQAEVARLKECNEFEQKVYRYQDALIDIAAGCAEPDLRASKALSGLNNVQLRLEEGNQ